MFQVGCITIINTKLPSCVDIIRSTSLGFHSWCPESTRPTDSCFQCTSCENLVMYSGLCQQTLVVLYNVLNKLPDILIIISNNFKVKRHLLPILLHVNFFSFKLCLILLVFTLRKSLLQVTVVLMSDEKF